MTPRGMYARLCEKGFASISDRVLMNAPRQAMSTSNTTKSMSP